MTRFLTSDEWQWRLARTIVQGVLGVVVANAAWDKWEYDDDDDGAGNDCDQVDMVELTICPYGS